MFSTVLEDSRSADILEFCFQAAKRSYLDSVELQEGLFVDCEAWHILVSKLSDNCSTILQESRFADLHE